MNAECGIKFLSTFFLRHLGSDRAKETPNGRSHTVAHVKKNIDRGARGQKCTEIGPPGTGTCPELVLRISSIGTDSMEIYVEICSEKFVPHNCPMKCVIKCVMKCVMKCFVDEVRDEVHDEMSDEVRDEVLDEVRDEMLDEVRDEVCDEMGDELRDEVSDEV